MLTTDWVAEFIEEYTDYIFQTSCSMENVSAQLFILYVAVHIVLYRLLDTCPLQPASESVATLPQFGLIELQKWFDQISSQ